MHKRRKAILDYLIANSHRTVKYDELQYHLGLRTPSNIKWHMAKLVREGYIKITPRKIEVLKNDKT